jgi:hypothetical protein
MWASAGRATIEQNRRVRDVFSEFGVETPAFSALPPAPPLCFMHIPKTGGASAIMWLESMFGPDEIAPCRNTVDFEELRSRPQVYRLYSGHILSHQLEIFPPNAQWVTIFRDPVEIAVSAYHHRRLAPPDDWEQDRAEAASTNSLRGDDSHDKAIAEEMSLLFQQSDLRTAIRRRVPSLRIFMRDILLRTLGATNCELERAIYLDDNSPELQELRQIQMQRAESLLARFSVVGDYTHYEEFLLLTAALRGWPAPPPLPRIHDFGVSTRTDAADPELRAEFFAYSPCEERIADLARARSAVTAKRLRALCGGVTAKEVDAHHRRRVFETAPLAPAFDVSADEPWSGCG